MMWFHPRYSIHEFLDVVKTFQEKITQLKFMHPYVQKEDCPSKAVTILGDK